MTWCSLSAKDGAAAALGRRHWDVAEQSVPAPHFGGSDFNAGRSPGILGIILNLSVHGLEGEINSSYDESQGAPSYRRCWAAGSSVR